MRVVSSTLHSTAMADLQRAQSQLLQAQRQAGSENKAADLAGFGRDAANLISARSYMAQAEAFIGVGKEANARLSTQAVAFEQLEVAAQDIRSAVSSAIGMDRSDELMENVRQAFQSAVGALNTTHAGKYVFGGIREDTAPFNATTIADVSAAASVDDLFENAERKAEIRLDTTTTVTVAPTAQEIGQDLMLVVDRLASFEASYAPLGGSLSSVESAELQSILTDVTSAMQSIIGQRSVNGGVQQRVERVTERNEEQAIFFNNLVAGIQQVDLAEVATRITQAQTQLQASSQIYGQLSRLTLLDYLR
jgi:flagellar hook-associated protein 3 FlgL